MPEPLVPCIDEDLEAFLRGPISVFLGTVDALGMADATRGAGLVPLDGNRLRVLIARDAPVARANAAVGARASVIATDITNYRSLQWKGRVVEAGGPRTPGDTAIAHRHAEAFAVGSPQVGIPSDQVPRIFPADIVPIVVEVTEIFDQSPGPGAGRRIEARAAARREAER